MKREVQKFPVSWLIFSSDFNRHNTIIYIKNHTTYNLGNTTIERTGMGGHPIELGTIKAMSSDVNEEMYPSPIMEKSDLILNYVLNGENHSSVIHGNIFLTDIRPIVIDIIEENGELIFSATRIKHEDIIN